MVAESIFVFVRNMRYLEIIFGMFTHHETLKQSRDDRKREIPTTFRARVTRNQERFIQKIQKI